MKQVIISLFFTLVVTALHAQEVSVQIKVANKKAGDYWIEVADRNCGAKSNGIDSYGEYYSWSLGEKAAERKVPEVAGKACEEFRGGGHSDWRLPVIEEVWALMHKCKRAPAYASLQSERADTTAVIYFPYAGMIEQGATKPIQLDERGCFWSGYGSGGSASAVYLELYPEIANNPGTFKDAKMPVRCVRTVE